MKAPADMVLLLGKHLPVDPDQFGHVDESRKHAGLAGKKKLAILAVSF